MKKSFLAAGIPLGFLALALGLNGLSAVQHAASAAQATQAEKPFVVEYYYKAKWGYQEEFIRLFKKNHYPLLLKEKEIGRILEVSAVRPRYHATEDGRWDVRVTIVWKNVATAHDNFDPATILKQLFPDQETFRREEQRRFEILAAHWDLPIVELKLD